MFGQNPSLFYNTERALTEHHFGPTHNKHVFGSPPLLYKKEGGTQAHVFCASFNFFQEIYDELDFRMTGPTHNKHVFGVPPSII